jgi:hypothetical protein
METKLARFLDALDNDVEPVATEFPAMFREAVELARGTMKEPPTAAMRPHLPPKVHCVDVLTARCQMAEIDWYVEKCRIELLRKEFEARATSATQPLPIHAVDVESVVVDGDDPGAGLSMIRSDFDKNMHVWNAVFATRSSPPRAEPRSVDFTPPAPLPDWLQARRSPRQSQHISVASPTRHVTTMRNAAWFRAQAPPPAILVRGALALATACVIAIVILYINV